MGSFTSKSSASYTRLNEHVSNDGNIETDKQKKIRQRNEREYDSVERRAVQSIDNFIEEMLVADPVDEIDALDLMFELLRYMERCRIAGTKELRRSFNLIYCFRCWEEKPENANNLISIIRYAIEGSPVLKELIHAIESKWPVEQFIEPRDPITGVYTSCKNENENENVLVLKGVTFRHDCEKHV